ncbi:MAG: EAL domain-containing protein [Alphaproteobacteria bacterium]|uniref:EAL domain-containing protein n=1 Tax=Candidatus Nitrobium versatile TaxID=2884831 RepID=A0A953M219_9BACT|nr:EAL domain-containing protein [Candidatus Nitrobium versatile]
MGKALRVLVVEDSEDDALLVLREIRKGGYEVTAQRVDTAPALEAALREGEWNIIISDYVMPHFGGLAALELLKKSGIDLPFILVSGKIGEGTAVDAMKAGAHDYILKDNLTRLVPAIERELREAEVRRERRRAEEALRRSQQQLLAMMDNSPAAIYMKDTEGRFLLINRRFEELFHISRKSAIGKTDYDLFPRETADSIHANDLKVLESGHAGEWEEEIPQDDTLHTYISIKYPLFDASGTPYVLCGISTDITERKRTEERIREIAHQQEAILDSIPDRAWLKDREGRYIAVNEAYGKAVGRTPAEVAGKTDPDIWPHDIAERFRADDREVMRSGKRMIIEERMVTPAGEVEWFETIKTPLRDEKGEAVGTTGIARDITKRKQMEETIRFQAYHDLLTGLPNRTLFMDRLALEVPQAQRTRKRIAVLFLDLDRFKNINDSLGHTIGDHLLQNVADRLKGHMRETDTLARVGGDEFTVLLPLINQVEDAAKIADKIIGIFKTPFITDGHELHITSSIGISIYPEDGTQAETLLKNADIAMYHAKDQGRNNFQFYNPALNIRTLERIQLENRLRQTVEHGELVVHYQPQVSIKTRKMVGAEALVRWRHPEHGLLNPLQFIPVAEEAGIIVSIDQWVLRTACAQLKKWLKAGYPPLYITTNLSARQFQQPNLADTVMCILDETGLPPQSLGIEITETLAMQDTELTARNLKELSAWGVRFSIDDFGTGYSSLSYLKKLPLHKLKIDKSFIMDLTEDPDYQSIVTAVIAMAHSLKLEVTAEGVETEEQVAFLKANGCDEIQGYFFSKPVPADEFGQILSQSA